MGVRLHVTNGESAGEHAAAGRRSAAPCCSWQDALHEGPVPALPREELLRTRAGFLAECGWGTPAGAILSSLERRDRQLLDAFHGGRATSCSGSSTTSTTSCSCSTCSRSRTRRRPRPRLIVVGSFPGRPSFAGLGELTADELETLWPARRPA